MHETDLYFTHTIVGAPLTLALGKPQQLPALHRDALTISARTGRQELGEDWRQWFSVYTRGQAPVGYPWRVPSRFRRFLMRYALLLAISGWLACALLAVAVVGVWAHGSAQWHWPQHIASQLGSWLRHLQ